MWLPLMFVTILVSIEHHCCVHFQTPPPERLTLRISFEVIFEVTFSEELDILIKLMKRIIWQSCSQTRLVSQTSGIRKANANIFILVMHPPFLCKFCGAGGHYVLETRQSTALSIYISPCLLMCETLACTHHYSPPRPGWFPSTVG